MASNDHQPSYQDLLEENRRLKEALAARKWGDDDDRREAPSQALATSLPSSSHAASPPAVSTAEKDEGCTPTKRGPLSTSQIRRYSRQLLVPAVGVRGQRALLTSSVLVIGAGGLGSSVLLYLAGAGVGRLGVVDYDTVEVSNLHRQVIHHEKDEGRPKALSACQAIQALNSSVECEAHAMDFSSANGLSLVRAYDVVVDASDNPRTRYLVNDACVLTGKPLVSGAALGTEGQVTVYHHEEGPCYRCLYPKPLPAETQRSCSDNGVVGVVPGVIGCLQAMEVIKILTGAGQTLARRLCLYDAMQGSFHTIRLPPRSPACAVCGPQATITTLQDTETFSCSHQLRPVEGGDNVSTTLPLPPENQVTCKDYGTVRDSGERHVLLDVRDPVQFDICSLPGAINMPMAQLTSRLQKQQTAPQDELELSTTTTVYVMCRRGVLSCHATRLLLDHGYDKVKNVVGGLTEWHRTVDPAFPIY